MSAHELGNESPVHAQHVTATRVIICAVYYSIGGEIKKPRARRYCVHAAVCCVMTNGSAENVNLRPTARTYVTCTNNPLRLMTYTTGSCSRCSDRTNSTVVIVVVLRPVVVRRCCRTTRALGGSGIRRTSCGCFCIRPRPT